ncbi:MAG: MBL fold metallo-hydrolase RNA specificity domain-containing protein [Alphaproteobacteria bacterium]
MSLRLKFCGAAGTVTGSCTWVTHPGGQFLVDCGMFQGPKTVKELNYGPFPFDPGAIDFVLLTHAHTDHAGLIPKLIRHGFAGPVYSTAGTRDLLSYMLPDSGTIQEREVELLNRRNAQRGRPQVTPIYTAADGEAAIQAFRAVDYRNWTDVGAGVRARWWNAGHILGAASVELEIAAAPAPAPPLRLLFSGDIGPDRKLFHPDPDGPTDLDLVVCEATYGDRSRPALTPEGRRRQLAREVNDALAAGGVLLIPAFAVERTQELLADLSALFDAGSVPRVPLFLDSPLAIRATEVFARHAADLEDLSGPRGKGGSLLRHPNFHFTETVEQSKAIDRFTGRVIVLAASGMCEAGRIRHHLKRFLWQPNATVLLVGYQAIGTLGSLLQQGAAAVRIMGEDVKVRARIRTLDVYSGHADAEELVAWVAARQPVRGALVLTHGEGRALAGLRDRLLAAGHAEVLVPALDDEIEVGAGGRVTRRRSAPRRLAPEAVARPDWHNDLAQFSLDLREALEGAAGEKARAVILRRVKRALGDR